MLDPNPAWTFVSRKPLSLWYGHVLLEPQYVVGQWFCVDRSTGAMKWQKSFVRPNTICGIDSDTIVASEMRSDGPWTATFGCYGISLEDGSLIWTSHNSGFGGRLTRWLDFVPGYTNGFRDRPHYLEDGKVYCESGRVLDVRTGMQVLRVRRGEVLCHERERTIGWRFYEAGLEEANTSVAVDGMLLRHVRKAAEMRHRDFDISAETEDGTSVWTFSTVSNGRHVDGNYYSYRLVPPFVVFVLSESPRFKPHPTIPHAVVQSPTRWHVVTLDLASGSVLNDFPLGNDFLEECRIEDVDEGGLLIGKSDQTLTYFRRTS